MTELIVTDDVTIAATTWIERELNLAMGQTGRASFALSGGSTPAPIYRALAARGEVDWARVDLFFADERCVPPDHEDSNFNLVVECFLDQVVGGRPQVHRMLGELEDSAAAALAYGEVLPDRLDVCLLGMGPDGHTASLFPGHPLVGETEGLVGWLDDSPKPPSRRLTLTAPAIRAAHRVIVVARGADKSWALRHVLEGDADPVPFPARLAREGTWVVDVAAASELEGAGA